MVSSPAVGDIDGDKKPDVVEASAEVYGSTPQTEGRVYAWDAAGKPKPGWPIKPPAIAADAIPIAGEGTPASPSLADVERVLKVKIDLTIPSSQLVPRSLNSGVPAYFSDPTSEVSLSIDRIADKLLGSPISHQRSAPAGRKKLRAVFGLG